MRTSIFLGLYIIAMAIMQSAGIPEFQVEVRGVYACFFLAFMFMDIVDFIWSKK